MTELDVNRRRGGQCNTNNFEVRNGTALHWAAYYGKVEIAKKFLERGASMLKELLAQLSESPVVKLCR